MKTFILTHVSRKTLLDYLEGLPDDGSYKVEVKKVTSKRSLAQNALYWEWMTIIGDSTGYRKDEIHDLMRYAHLEPITKEVMGQVITELPSTTKLSTKDFTEYLNLIENWASDMGIVLPHPEDLYYKAMGYMR